MKTNHLIGNRPPRAFTLLEVMIAAGIFFMAIFAILSMVNTNLNNARLLQDPVVDGGMVIADYCLTNQFTEGQESGDFGEIYPDYGWSRDVHQVDTNGYFEVDCTVTHKTGNSHNEEVIRAFFYRPDSPAGAGF